VDTYLRQNIFVDQLKGREGQEPMKIEQQLQSVLLIYVYVTGYFDIFCFLQIPIIGPSPEVTFRIRNNALRCDCRDYDVIAKLRIFTRSLWLFRLECSTPSQLSGKEVSVSACLSTGFMQH